MTQHATWPPGPTIRFKLGPALLVLTQEEVRGLLARDLDLFGQALLRGKAVRRRRQYRTRTQGQTTKGV